MKILKKTSDAMIDLGMVLVIGLAFVGMTVIAYLVAVVQSQLVGDYNNSQHAWGEANRSFGNITSGFDNTINLILIAITIFILALAISALYFIRRK